MSAPVLTTDLPGFPRRQGKVRDIYDLGTVCCWWPRTASPPLTW